MRSFNRIDQLLKSVPSDVVLKLSTIDVGRGSEASFRDQLPGLLGELSERSRVASITASSAIEGVVVPDPRRSAGIINGRIHRLRSRNEQEIAGYRDCLDYLFQRDWRPLNVGLLLHLHRMLFAHTAIDGGHFKPHDNLVVDRNSDGTTSIRFRPVAATETEYHVAELVDQFNQTADRYHPILAIGLFILDLSIVHPFEDGNGRVGRAITNALLDHSGYTVGRYVSLEQLIADDPDPYYSALLASTHHWHEDQHDPWPWLRYFSTILATAYETFCQRAAAGRGSGTKQERVQAHVLRHAPDTFTMADLRRALPGISDQTIRLVLDRLRAEGRIKSDGSGRSAIWRQAEPNTRQ
ncbi:Fic family protein [Stackebrandtia endophytica]|uniref:Fic family protein n=1 Tax=Stackebrandtia endophytica TaxID=1496996 RepID=A0A543AWB2_9ACTN|nr:Fic family protein [Stackebrandtia endophytica]TQL76876.1 Fic family protein [Stackebrandtia endophytica]